jgi:hypothetical protein
MRKGFASLAAQAKHAYGYTPEAPIRVIPSAAAISRMEECFDWLMLVNPEDAPQWITGDSRDIATLAKGVDADLIFSCPPYWNLEVYSDDPADLSTLSKDAFFDAYARIIAGAVSRLRDDRFAVWVIGDALRSAEDGHHPPLCQ